MNPIDLATIIIFSLIVIITGISFSGSGKNLTSFFAAGGAVPWYINGLSLFMGFFSAGTFVVWGSIAYTHGMVSITIQWTMAFAGFVVGFFISPAWRKNKALTAAEYIQLRLGRKTQKAYTYLFLFISLFTTGAFLYPVAKIVEVATGFPLEYCILVLGGASILYVTAGGLWAVVITDVLQFIILFAAVIIVVPLAFMKIGGFSEFINSSPDTFFNIVSGEYTWGFIIAFALYNLFFLGGNWAYVQRYTSVATPKDAKKVGWLFGALYLVSPVLWMIPPMLYRVYNPSLGGLADEGAYLLMCKEALPAGMLGLMLGGMIFATASSLNATLNISAGVFTNDLFKSFFPDSKEKTLMKVARISTISFGVLAIGIALLVKKMGGIVNVVISVAAITGVPLYLPVIWSLFSKRQNGKTVLFATLASLSVNLLMKFAGPLAGIKLNRAEEMITGVLVPAVILTIIEVYLALSKKTDPGYVKYSEGRTARTLLQAADSLSGKEKSTADNKYGIKVIGISISVSSLLIILLGITASTGKLLVSGIGLLLLVLGATIIYKSLNPKNNLS
jgi:solute:Na+ symporter, SSS family